MTMNYKRLRDVILYLGDVHREVAAACGKIEDAGGEDDRFMAERIRRSEEKVATRLVATVTEEQVREMNAWIQFVENDELEETRRGLKEAAPDESDALIERMLAIHEQVVKLLKRLAGGVNSPYLGDSLDSTIEMEENLLHRLGQAAQMRHDL